MLDCVALAQACAPAVAPQTMAAVARVESGFNPYAIGIVGGWLARPPANQAEAIATAKALAAGGWNFSLGIAQINRYNLPKYRLSYEQAFEPCANLRVGSMILKDCYLRASARYPDQQRALQAAFSCYYSGNFTRGFKPGAAGKSYVQKVLANAETDAQAIPVVPAIQPASRAHSQLKAVSEVAAPPAQRPADHAPVLLQATLAEPAQAGKGESNAKAEKANGIAKPAGRTGAGSSALVF